MFSRDAKHYRRTPRTTSEAFGPYAHYQSRKQARNDIIQVALSVVALGVVYGLLFGWRG
jgi:hypothetical protein